jgi:hypothetical protein
LVEKGLAMEVTKLSQRQSKVATEHQRADPGRLGRLPRTRIGRR